MTISATSQGLKPGVCTSSNRPANPYTGMMIFETDTDRLAVYNGSSWIMLADADTPPGLELVKTQTIGSAVSTFTVSDVFSADYDAYKIIISGGVASTTPELRMTLGSSSSGYYMAGNGLSFTGSAYSINQSNAAYWTVTAATTNIIHMNSDVMNPYLAKYTLIQGAYIGSGGALDNSGYHASATSYTSFTITTSTGTLTGGTIRVYGYRNS